jgi:putative phosphoesterase
MTRVGVMTDIHANLPALEATLAEIEKLDVDAIYCGGDLVGCGPHPNQVCELIRERAIPTIYGNYDYAIGRDLEDCGCAYIDKHDREIGQLSVDWTLAHANRRSKEFMGELPFDLRFELAGKRVRLVHGSPRKVNEYQFEDKPARTFERIAALADCDLLVFGHTHKPLDPRVRPRPLRQLRLRRQTERRRRTGRLLRPRSSRRRRCRVDRAAYDALAVAREMRAVGLPDELADKLVAAA